MPMCSDRKGEKMKRILPAAVIAAMLLGLCGLLWPHSFAKLQPECDSVIILRIDTAADCVSQTFTRETYASGSVKFERVMDIFSRYTYHRSLRTLAGASAMDGNHAGFWLSVYLDHGDDRVDIVCGGTGEIAIDGLVWRVGYWGDRASLAMMEELAAVLEK